MTERPNQAQLPQVQDPANSLSQEEQAISRPLGVYQPEEEL